MVRVNGQGSAGKFANVYPAIATQVPVLHMHIEAPLDEAALWIREEPLGIEADWKLELGQIRFASQEGFDEILLRCSVQGQFKACVKILDDGILAVALESVGNLTPLGAPCY